MSLVSKLTSKKPSDKQFRDILVPITPTKKDYYTISGNKPFSNDYLTLVPNLFSNRYYASLVGTAFDYLARFRIAQYIGKVSVIKNLVAETGYKYLGVSPNIYSLWMNQIKAFIEDPLMSPIYLYDIAIRLAKLEQLVRAPTLHKELDIDYYLYADNPEEVLTDLENLMTVFEIRFMIPDLIKKKSKVIFNPNFGLGSLLVGGADADLFIDGTLYDFKTTKTRGFRTNDSLQLIGYFFLNEFAIVTEPKEINFKYKQMQIERLAFYKGRFGEVEYFDVKNSLSESDIKTKLRELADYFQNNMGDLPLHSKINNPTLLLKHLT
ncbi:hypothetical protein P8859_15160 [Bacillus spizizenii]|nr:hypothetical protein [Bacillus spizizenii]MCY8313176.1 hypothetical protein [Bacillus spizizenii]MCY8417334.1 hypothetical protein [Bacillus spizizenii]MCY9333484.1 hypothetical protein [Bacillus spizizenii]MEC0620629.1 hypothetical protein [Bacillus spizizenii]